MSSDDPLLVPPPPPPLRRYRVEVGDGSWWELAWRPQQHTFEALHLTVDQAGVDQALAWYGLGMREVASLDELIERVDHPIPEQIIEALAADASQHHAGFPAEDRATAGAVRTVGLEEWLSERPERRVPHIDFGMRWIDPATPGDNQRVSWIPDTGELYVTDRAHRDIRVLAVIPTRRQVDEALAGWAAAGAAPDPPLAWVQQRAARWMELHAPTDEVPPEVAGAGAASPPAPDTNAHREGDASHLAAWEAELRGWEARLTAWEQSLYAQAGTEPCWSLPAEPATEALRALLAEPAFSTADVEEFARGFDLDTGLTKRLITGGVAQLDIEEIAQLCNGLHCSPYDLWGAEQARSILHAYGPERWPRYIEPLDDARHPRQADDFIARRLDAQATETAGPVAALATAWTENDTEEPGDDAPDVTVDVTCYRRTGVLAIDADGRSSVVDDASGAPDDTVEYHFSFRQLGDPLRMTVEVSRAEFATGPLPGFDVIPQLAAAANQLHARPSMTDVELIRFQNPDCGAEQWLGWDSQLGNWQTWDDPRRYYPGDPSDVLDCRDLATAPPIVELAEDEAATGILRSTGAQSGLAGSTANLYLAAIDASTASVARDRHELEDFDGPSVDL